MLATQRQAIGTDTWEERYRTRLACPGWQSDRMALGLIQDIRLGAQIGLTLAFS